MRMRKLSLTVLILAVAVVLVGTLYGCTGFYAEYFNDFSTTEPFETAEVTLTLPEGVSVESYFGDGYYLIRRYLFTSGSTEVYSYGIATADYVIIEPMSGDNPTNFFSGVVDIKNGIAIVSVKTLVNASYVDRLGAVLLVGENKYSDALVPYRFYVASSVKFHPIRFAGDYVAVLGDKDTALTTSTLAVNHYTFYKLNEQTKQLEQAFLMQGNMFSTFEVFDHYMYAQHAEDSSSETAQSYYQIAYYDVAKLGADGYVTIQEVYEPFSSEARTNFLTTASLGTYDIYTYYMGNGIFMRAGIFKCATEFTGYTMIIPDENKSYYAVMLSDRYSIGTNESYKNEKLFPILVVNSFNDSEMRTIASSFNSGAYTQYDKQTEPRPIYDYPTYPVSSMVADGKSLVYYYYFPYAANNSYSETEQVTAQVSFQIMDASLSGSKQLSNLIMPAVFVDGVGFETNSPYFNALLGDSSALTFSYNNKALTLSEYVWSNTEKKVFETKVYHNRMAIVQQYDALTETTTYGAYKYSLSKKSAKLAVPFVYSELTPFFGDYATGSQTAADGTRTFYRVGQGGEQEVINNVYALKNGVYVARVLQDGKYVYALIANSGTLLIDYQMSQVTLFEEFLTDGQYVSTTAIAKVGGNEVFYRLRSK